jgi:6-pyruvoyltetrahydropterin/6-carboxytetrahydropterin synthase
MRHCTRKIEFDAGHRVHGHESKCARLHGHRYVLEITAAAPELDGIGRVVDFSVLKGILGRWVDETWDHRTLLWEDDDILGSHTDPPWFEQHAGFVRVPFNPTAENMAAYLLDFFGDLLLTAGVDVTITKVRVYETPNCWAESELAQ